MPYLAYFAITGLLPVILLICAGAFIQPLSGDLTRLGHLSERDFGWNQAQPSLSVDLNRDGGQPDVLILGDSFSEKNVWQTVARQSSGLHFLTYQWQGLDDPACLKTWIQAVHERHPQTRVLLIETVERQFIGRFSAAQKSCPGALPEPVRIKRDHTLDRRPLFAVDTMLPDLKYAVQALRTTWQPFPKPMRSGATVIAPLMTGHLFSNRKSSTLLYYRDDDLKQHWSEADMARSINTLKDIQEFAQALGMTVSTMVVPDKSSVYGPFMKQPQFKHPPPNVWQALAQQDIRHVDLEKPLSRQAPLTQDLYLPDDTHMSTEGYVLIGQSLAAHLKELFTALGKTTTVVAPTGIEPVPVP